MLQDQRDKKLQKKFSFRDIIKRQDERPGEQISPDFKVFDVKTPAAEAESPKEQLKKREEQLAEIDKKRAEEIIKKGRGSSVSSILDAQKQEEQQVESVLSEGLEDIYLKMDPATQQKFKEQGEDTARAINVLLHKTKVKVKEIVNLIIKWLKLIPGVNKFFVEQEAKIKADKLMAMKRKRDEEREHNVK
jgi:hypothetical protein